jgi:hypothetical protein
MSEIHAIQFNKYNYNFKDIGKWLKEHNLTPRKLEETKNYYWVNIRPKNRYKKFIEKKITDDIILVIGFPK